MDFGIIAGIVVGLVNSLGIAICTIMLVRDMNRYYSKDE